MRLLPFNNDDYTLDFITEDGDYLVSKLKEINGVGGWWEVVRFEDGETMCKVGTRAAAILKLKAIKSA